VNEDQKAVFDAFAEPLEIEVNKILEMSVQEVYARRTAQFLLEMSKCPDWCYCVTKSVQMVESDYYVYRKGVQVKRSRLSELRRFSLNPECPLIRYLCPQNGTASRGGNEGTHDERLAERHKSSLYMHTIENTRFCSVVHECKVLYEDS
jgi:hypothetical protein